MTQPCNITLVSFSHRDKFYHKFNNYQCICGKVFSAMEDNVKRGKTKSCGCLIKTNISKANTKHGHTKRGNTSPTYISYQAMISRCTNKQHIYYYNYGGRGINIDETWLNSFDSFLLDMGKRPIGCTLDRLDNNKNYCKANCKWSTRKEQANNRRNNK